MKHRNISQNGTKIKMLWGVHLTESPYDQYVYFKHK